jgi:pyochelin biosynthesis protein PchG
MRSRRLKVVVAGTGFGRVYLSAFRTPYIDFELAGILARGSELSRACARHYDVPLWTDSGELPRDVDIACVVVGTAVNGGTGQVLAEQLLERRIHVLQEHPLHHDELVKCLRKAQQYGVVYRLNTHYVHIEPVRRFIDSARNLRRQQQPLFIDAVGAVQTTYSLFDIIGKALGELRPWTFGTPSKLPKEASALARHAPPFRSLDGVIGGIPLSLRIQNQLELNERDNHTHLFHRITIGSEGGTITLVNTHGPVIWSPKPHLPVDSQSKVLLAASDAPHLDFPSATAIGSADAPAYREILATIWPEGVLRALGEMREAIEGKGVGSQVAQYSLTLARVWRDAMAQAGPVEFLGAQTPNILPAGCLTHASTT